MGQWKVAAVAIFVAASFSVVALTGRPATYPGDPGLATCAYQDSSLPIEQRVADLVGRMTLEEKVSQLTNDANAVPRLGVPEYNWWNEALHGVARAGLATSFPQAIGLAATWDTALMREVATAISDEARAKHHQFASQGKRGIYQGLTFWSPNINIFRDPRWGRGMETYGEDPFLAGRLAVEFVKGMQGDDPHYLKTIATPKHYAVHSGPESERHVFDARIDESDFRDTYLPQFQAAVSEGGALSVMCAYNRVLGEPACSSSLLLDEILRKEWHFPGYVVSDCGAIDDIYMTHKVTATAAEAAARALKAGCDLSCGSTYRHLLEAVSRKLVSEREVDVALTRLFTARFRLGMFDPPEKVKWARIPYSVVDSDAHRRLALEAARESIVLLENENDLLPLSPKVKTIAVIGPNADDEEVLLGNYNGTPSHVVTPLEGLRAKAGNRIEVVYATGSEWAEGMQPRKEKRSSDALLNEAVEAARRAEVSLLFLGLSPRLEGEEMNVPVKGFKGGDRVDIGLPAPQQRLLEAIVAVGKPVVLILLNGSALACPWAAAHLPAIVEAWYPGQAAGTAIADVLFGDYNPSGRLPVTFYASVDQLPPFDDYKMAGRTYRYFKGEPLFPFGHGLSYTHFLYRNLRVPAAVTAGKSVSITVELQNTGKVEGGEVVQAYIERPNASWPVPRRTLVGFKRVFLKPGERTTVQMETAPISAPGPVRLSVGPNQHATLPVR